MGIGRKLVGRERRHVRIRKKVFGTSERPRFNIFRSAKHIYAQIIDDVNGNTLVSSSTMSKSLRGQVTGKKVEQAKAIGMAVAEACKAKNIETVVFDRGGYRYHGRVKAIAEGAREGGLKF
ncbi:MAG: 50S ribosomal protein L18 [Deltaproteobacteria bacterium]|nr:50S ribosomal protein L18 [Deltaproteobacteria bacterium]